MKTVVIETIPHAEQRYDTVGDYQTGLTTVLVRVSALPDWRYEALIAVHELVEKFLCDHRGIKEADIDRFDLAHEAAAKAGHAQEWIEPGDDPQAPYHREHQFATLVESLLASKLGVDWDEYERALHQLEQERTDG